MKNKKILGMILVGLLILIVIFLIIFIWKPFKSANQPGGQNTVGQVPYQPEFLSTEEKAQLQIPTDLNIQVLKRGSKGEVVVYKIIKNDSEVVTDPSSVKPISPRLSK